MLGRSIEVDRPLMTVMGKPEDFGATSLQESAPPNYVHKPIGKPWYVNLTGTMLTKNAKNHGANSKKPWGFRN